MSAIARPKIYVFVSGNWGNDVCMIAVAEDGESIASHVSSNVEWGKRDMGLTPSCEWKHDLYSAKYPDGYELVFVEDWRSHPFLSEQCKRNRAEYERNQPKHEQIQSQR